MFKKSLLTLALASAALCAQAHQLWLAQDASGPVRVYVGDADDAHDSGEEVAKLAATTQVFTADRKRPAALTVKHDHLEAAVSDSGDVRLFNDQVWKPWKTKEGKLQAAVFSARAGRSDTGAGNDFELVPVQPQGNVFALLFKGQPQAGAKVTVVSPDKWTKVFKTDTAGRLKVPLKDKGRYVLIGTHNADAVGDVEIAGQKVQRLAYTTTLSFVAP